MAVKNIIIIMSFLRVKTDVFSIIIIIMCAVAILIIFNNFNNF